MTLPLRAGAFLCFLLAVLATYRLRAEEQTAQQLEAYLQVCAEVEDFSGSVLVAKGGQTLWAKGYGWANREHEVANTPQTKFRLGSITWRRHQRVRDLHPARAGRKVVHRGAQQHRALAAGTDG